MCVVVLCVDDVEVVVVDDCVVWVWIGDLEVGVVD